jgi:hypothetical protein
MSDAVTPEFLEAVSAYTDVPVEYLCGDAARAVWDSAQRAVDWKQAIVPRPPTAAVSPTSRPTTVPVQQLVPGDDWMRAWRAGRLGTIGGTSAAAAPEQRASETQRMMCGVLAVALVVSLTANVFAAVEIFHCIRYCFRRRVLWRAHPAHYVGPGWLMPDHLRTVRLRRHLLAHPPRKALRYGWTPGFHGSFDWPLKR